MNPGGWEVLSLLPQHLPLKPHAGKPTHHDIDFGKRRIVDASSPRANLSPSLNLSESNSLHDSGSSLDDSRDWLQEGDSATSVDSDVVFSSCNSRAWVTNGTIVESTPPFSRRTQSADADTGKMPDHIFPAWHNTLLRSPLGQDKTPNQENQYPAWRRFLANRLPETTIEQVSLNLSWASRKSDGLSMHSSDWKSSITPRESLLELQAGIRGPRCDGLSPKRNSHVGQQTSGSDHALARQLEGLMVGNKISVTFPNVQFFARRPNDLIEIREPSFTHQTHISVSCEPSILAVGNGASFACGGHQSLAVQFNDEGVRFETSLAAREHHSLESEYKDLVEMNRKLCSSIRSLEGADDKLLEEVSFHYMIFEKKIRWHEKQATLPILVVRWHECTVQGLP